MASDTPHNADKTFATDVSSRVQLKANTIKLLSGYCKITKQLDNYCIPVIFS